MDERVRNDPALAHATEGHSLVIEQVVTADDLTGEAPLTVGHWHIVIEDGSVRFVPGAPAGAATVRFTVNASTAGRITSGELSPREAFMEGRLRLGGDTAALASRGDLLAVVSEVFSADASGAGE